MRQANNGSHPYTLGCIISLVNACDKYAAVGGSDSAEGTDSAPFRTAQRLVDSLKPGQTGCLRSGTYTEADDTLTISGGGSFGRRVVIRSAPGERTTFLGRVYITEAGDYVTLRNLVLDGSYGPKCASGETCSVLPSPTVNGDHAHLIGNDISNRRAGWEATLAGSCINVGDSEVKVKETLIENNRIHDCGRIPSSNHDQGIYLTSSRGAIVRNNWIYDNADRGIQFYTDADGTLVENNVIDANGQGVLFSGGSSTTSDNNEVRNNVISNSKIRWLVEDYWSGPVGRGNTVHHNCLWPTNPKISYNQNNGVQPNAPGFTAANNSDADPIFADALNGDLTVPSSSACRSVYSGP
jgi:parallel beta-helix repeat protein